MKEAEQRKKNGGDIGVGETLTPQMLVHKYASAVLGLCIANTKNFHDSEDIMQEVFLKAFTKFHTLRDADRARPWLLQIARRMCIDYHRKRSASQAIPEDIPAKSGTSNERIERLYAAISKLPDDYRETITLYYLNGHNCSSVARTLELVKLQFAADCFVAVSSCMRYSRRICYDQ